MRGCPSDSWSSIRVISHWISQKSWANGSSGACGSGGADIFAELGQFQDRKRDKKMNPPMTTRAKMKRTVLRGRALRWRGVLVWTEDTPTYPTKRPEPATTLIESVRLPRAFGTVLRFLNCPTFDSQQLATGFVGTLSQIGHLYHEGDRSRTFQRGSVRDQT